MTTGRTFCRLLAFATALTSCVVAPRLAASPPAAAATRPTLVLELAGPRLRLLHGGALLREYSVDAIELGRPVTLFVARDVEPLASAAVRIFETLEPGRRVERPIIIPAAPGSDLETVEIPPTPEAAIPAPDRYRLHFDKLTLEVVAAGPSAGADWRAWPRAALWRLGEVAESISRRPETRLRLVMPRDEAGALYRSVPSAVDLIIR